MLIILLFPGRTGTHIKNVIIFGSFALALSPSWENYKRYIVINWCYDSIDKGLENATYILKE